MEQLSYHRDQLFLEGCALADIAKQYQTPCYVYSKQALLNNIQAYQQALEGQSHCIAYAVKANSNLSLLKLFHAQGLGFDIVSGGELQRLLAVNIPLDNVYFSGVGKSVAEIELALANDMGCFNVESVPELERIQAVAEAQQKIARIAIRVNPNVDPKTHPYISTGQKHNKFGVSLEEALVLCLQATESNMLDLQGLSFHIGSQLKSMSPILEAFESVLDFILQLTERKIKLSFIDIGGGLGVAYEAEDKVPRPQDYLSHVIDKIKQHDLDLKIVIEPGRSIIANAGLLLTEVQYVKKTAQHHFVIVNAAMNDFGRPALYQAYHQCLAVEQKKNAYYQADIVGPVCESSDFLALDRKLNVQAGDLLSILHTGAYGMTMSSNYNSRTRAPEILVDRDQIQLIKERETFTAMIQSEVACL